MTRDDHDSQASDHGVTRRALLALISLVGGGVVLAEVLGDAPAARASPVWVGGWNSPLSDGTPGINSEFLEGGPGLGTYVGHDYHLGLDLAAASNAPVYSIGDGTVLDVQTGNYPGQAVFIKYTAQDGTEFVAVYGHIDTDISGMVAAGQQIGTVFAHSAHHLHFGIRTIISTEPRWGAWDLDGFPFTNGFTEPREFLAAHPMSTSVAEEESMHPAGVVYRIVNPQGGMNGVCVVFGAGRIAVPGTNGLALALAGLINFGVTKLPDNVGNGNPVPISQDVAEYLAQTYAPAGTLANLVVTAGQTGQTQHWP